MKLDGSPAILWLLSFTVLWPWSSALGLIVSCREYLQATFRRHNTSAIHTGNGERPRPLGTPSWQAFRCTCNCLSVRLMDFDCGNRLLVVRGLDLIRYMITRSPSVIKFLLSTLLLFVSFLILLSKKHKHSTSYWINVNMGWRTLLTCRGSCRAEFFRSTSSATVRLQSSLVAGRPSDLSIILNNPKSPKV